MKKYMYIDTCKREIYEPQFFDKKEQAVYHMVNDFCTVKNVSLEVIPDAVDEETLKNALSILKKKGYLDAENNIDLENLKVYGAAENGENWWGQIFEVEV